MYKREDYPFYRTATGIQWMPVTLTPCDPLGVRTQDPILKRDVLYLLS